MAFVDELKIYAQAGNGGNGVVRWRREKFIDKGGPAGGDGGRGGDIYVLAVRDNNILSKYQNNQKFLAENGEAGRKGNQHGLNGKNLIIKLPIGSIIKNIENKNEISLLNEGQKELLLKGGNGGFGNTHFKSSANTTPQEWTSGKAGDLANFEIELQLMADVGLIGLPNAGKSSLINELTNAGSRVADYPFTTLDPNLGAFHGYIIADIPGLIENASKGKGLGHKFLRHIKRTKILVHLVSFDSLDTIEDYQIIRKELKSYDPELIDKKEVIVLSKSDLADKDTIKNKIKEFKKVSKNVFAISIYDSESVKNLADSLIKLLRK